ncbi:glycosyltransferase family 2 protein [Arenicella chitinivorans]|uniref:glycosyltransferase family 2 protein n=1 Tax=Arenicella chitinivorans TaxID=1329800 RepID=UPI00167AEAB2|nr:glycosyltransferase [Arenicella chitinivorans]
MTDNGSEEQDFEKLELFLRGIERLNSGRGPKFILIRNEVNSGFSLGMNLGIAKLQEEGVDWVWMLNNDVMVEQGTVSSLVASLRQKSPNIYGFQVAEAGKYEFTGFYKFNPWTTRYRPVMLRSELDSLADKNLYVSGANMVVHQSVFQAIGCLNPRTFLYFEELDFASRARTHGFTQIFIDNIKLTHLGAGSSGEGSLAPLRLYHETWSMLDFYRTHRPSMFIWVLVFRAPVRAFLLLCSGRAQLVKYLLSASRDFFHGRNKNLVVPKMVSVQYFNDSRPTRG